MVFVINCKYHMIPIHVINLERRIDRKVMLLQEFEKHSITNFTFYKAIEGKDIDFVKLAADGLISYRDRQMTVGEFGCFLSHLNILKKILTSDEEIHLILEDDVYFVSGFIDKLNYCLSKVKNSIWDIFYLGINRPSCVNFKFLRGKYVGNIQDGIFYPKYKWWGTHGYLVKKSSVAKIINLITPIILPYDCQLMEVKSIHKLILAKTIIKSYNMDSDTNA